MRRWPILMCLPLLLAAAGCSESPVPASRGLTTQQELRKAGHWEVLADDTARQIAEVARSLPDDAGFFVEPLDPGMRFARSFHQYLLGSLVDEGVPVVMSRDARYRIHYATELIPHDEALRTPPTGSVALLGAGIWGLRELSRNMGEGFGADLTPLLIYEGVNAMGVLGQHAELTFTVSVLDGEQLVGRADATFYVPENEVAQFMPTTPAAPLVVRRPDWAEDPPMVRDIPLVSQ